MNRMTFGVLASMAAVGLGVAAFRPANAQNAAPAGGTGGPKYTIVETDGSNLLVVDNASNSLYYYTVDPGKEVGDDLKLRGSIDLNEVGKPVIKPKPAAK